MYIIYVPSIEVPDSALPDSSRIVISSTFHPVLSPAAQSVTSANVLPLPSISSTIPRRSRINRCSVAAPVAALFAPVPRLVAVFEGPVVQSDSPSMDTASCPISPSPSSSLGAFANIHNLDDGDDNTVS